MGQSAQYQHHPKQLLLEEQNSPLLLMPCLSAHDTMNAEEYINMLCNFPTKITAQSKLRFLGMRFSVFNIFLLKMLNYDINL